MNDITINDVRPEVLAFAVLMERRLREHDIAFGKSWKNRPAEDLAEAITYHAMAIWRRPELVLDTHSMQESVDTANYAMMLSDVMGALTPEIYRVARIAAPGLPQSIQEAPNSGDGGYRP